MGYSVKKRIFGSDLPDNIKAKVSLRQLYAESPNPTDEKLKKVLDPIGLSANDLEDFGVYSDFIDEENTPTINNLSSRLPFARMWTAVGISSETLLKEVTEDEAKTFEENKYKKDNQGKYVNVFKDEYRDKFIRVTGDKYNLYQVQEIPNSRVVYEINNHGDSPLRDVTTGADIFEASPPAGMGGTALTWKHGENDIELNAAGRHHVTPLLSRNQYKRNQNYENKYVPFQSNPPGITSISSETEGPLGTIKKTTVNFIVHEFEDFENIFLKFFMKPGAQVFIDYGWAISSINIYDPAKLIESTDIEEDLYGDDGIVPQGHGELDVILGHVINYDASVREDGGFNCSVEVVSKNTAILSTAFDPSLKQRVMYGLDVEALGYATANVLGDASIYRKASRWTDSVETEDQLRQTLKVAGIKFLGGMDAKLPGDYTPPGILSLEHGVFYGGAFQDNQKLFVNFGWFEDKFLNKEFGFSDQMDNLTNSNISNVKEDESSLKAKFNSRDSYCTYSKKLSDASRFRDYYEGAVVLYPNQWGDTITYNINNGMHPRYDDDGMGEWTTGEGYRKKYNEDVNLKRIPLREIFLSVDMIKDTLEASESVGDFLSRMSAAIKEGTGGIIDLLIQSNSYAQNSLCFVDRNYLLKFEPTKLGTQPIGDFLSELLTFKPYSPKTIVKDYDIKFKMPEGGLGNMIAIQNASNLDSAVSINDEIDGFVKMEKMERNKNLSGGSMTSVVETLDETNSDIIVHSVPSVGKESGRRFIASYKREMNQGFQFGKENFMQSNTTKTQSRKVKYKDIKGTNINTLDDFHATLNRQLNYAVGEEDLDGELIKPSTKAEKTSEDTKKSATDIARSNGQTLVPTPFEYFMRDAVHDEVLTRAPFMAVELSLKIYGMSGFVPGDLVRVDYLPQVYRDNVFFQVTKVSNSIEGGTWSTSLDLQMRIFGGERHPADAKFRVSKAYLRDSLKLINMEDWIHFMGNLLPRNLEEDPSINYQYIDYAFDTVIEASMDDWEWLPSIKSRADQDDTKKFKNETVGDFDYEDGTNGFMDDIDAAGGKAWMFANDKSTENGWVAFEFTDHGDWAYFDWAEEAIEYMFRSGVTCAYNSWCQFKEGDEVTIFTGGKYWIVFPTRMVSAPIMETIDIIFKYAEGRVLADFSHFENNANQSSNYSKSDTHYQVSTASPGGMEVTYKDVVDPVTGLKYQKKEYTFTTAVDNTATTYWVPKNIDQLNRYDSDVANLNNFKELLQKNSGDINETYNQLQTEILNSKNNVPVNYAISPDFFGTSSCGNNPPCAVNKFCDIWLDGGTCVDSIDDLTIMQGGDPNDVLNYWDPDVMLNMPRSNPNKDDGPNINPSGNSVNKNYSE